MFVVSRSTTGQYVVSDPATNTVVVGDDLAATFDRMVAMAAEAPARASEVPPPAAAKTAVAAGKHMLPYLALALLPFVWIGALHLSLGRLVSELRQSTAPAGQTEAMTQLQARLDRLERQAESRPAAAAAGARPRPGPLRPAGETPDDNDDDDPDDDDDTKADAKADGKADAKADAKPDAKADAKVDAKVDAKADAKAEPIEPDDDDGGAD